MGTIVVIFSELQAALEYEPLDLIRFIQKSFIPLSLMIEHAGMSETDIYNRTKEVFAPLQVALGLS